MPGLVVVDEIEVIIFFLLNLHLISVEGINLAGRLFTWKELGQPSIHLICHHPSPFPSQFMDSMQLDPETVDNLDAYNHIPPQLMEKCAALSVRPDTVKNLVQSMQGEQSTEQTGAGAVCKPSS